MASSVVGDGARHHEFTSLSVEQLRVLLREGLYKRRKRGKWEAWKEASR